MSVIFFCFPPEYPWAIWYVVPVHFAGEDGLGSLVRAHSVALQLTAHMRHEGGGGTARHKSKTIIGEMQEVTRQRELFVRKAGHGTHATAYRGSPLCF